jgi:hypothetical protein
VPLASPVFLHWLSQWHTASFIVHRSSFIVHPSSFARAFRQIP